MGSDAKQKISKVYDYVHNAVVEFGGFVDLFCTVHTAKRQSIPGEYARGAYNRSCRRRLGAMYKACDRERHVRA
jgi:hypothetical protein